MDCNRYLKFGTLLEKARAMGFDYLATGHYATDRESGRRFPASQAKGQEKGPVIFPLCDWRENLGSVLFPLAPYTKEEVRAMAEREKIPVFDKEESQDLCFVTRKGLPEFLKIRAAGLQARAK